MVVALKKGLFHPGFPLLVAQMMALTAGTPVSQCHIRRTSA
jgi:hypothetical protein